MEYKDFELNSLEYENALKLDKRSYIQFYISLLRNNQPILFSFSFSKDYNTRILKIFLFFFKFSLDLIVNALFFTDQTIHKIYEDRGNFNFIYQIPQILYSSIISGVIGFLIQFLALSQDNIVKFKQQKESTNLNENLENLISTLKIKFISFFITSFLLLLFFWYYISCFCGIYINTQTHLIKDTIISFITSLIYPFGFYLIPGIFRIYSLKREKPYIYKFADFLGILLV